MARRPSLSITVDEAIELDEPHDSSHDRMEKEAMHEDNNHNKHFKLETPSQAARKKLQLACLCSFLFMCIQVAGGYYAASLAVMTDAAHLFSDVVGFFVSLVAMYVGQWPATARMPFGYHRAEVLGAIVSILLIWIIALGLMITAVTRLIELNGGETTTDRVDGQAMFFMAVFGVAVNLLLMNILGHSHRHGHGHAEARPDEKTVVDKSPSLEESMRTPMSAVALIHGVEESTTAIESEEACENLNVRAAYIHALGDFLQSLGVGVAGGLIWYNPSWAWADPITTLVFSFVVLGTTWRVLVKSLHILMEGAPAALNLSVIEKRIRALPSVYDVHDLHIWMLTEGHYAASVHILPNGEPRAALRATQQLLASLRVRRQTVQLEDPTDPDWHQDVYCNWINYSNVADDGESKMSVPRAGTRKAAVELLHRDGS
ncbi:hypothetical protein PsorP6_011862 [Peronosclerospora sorghi]|uniref:Uncharacterized protein n=1 Tax=Peronosclerospora sorghi TaxID=230839 RepID=A0ACC0WJ58_9STRA|nr:hypothetical protein PsorP6_011862 [Peronosclerospora sorghi]